MSDKLTNINKLIDSRENYNTTIHEQEDEYRFSFDLTGYKESDISVFISENYLEVEAESRKEYSEEGISILQERDFHEKLTIPENANIDDVSTSYDFGIFVVSVAKKD